MRTALASVFAAAALCGAAWAASGSEVIAKIDVGGQPCGVVGTPTGVWVSDYKSGDLIKLDPATSTVALRVKTNAVPCEITYGKGSLWVPSRTGSLLRVDPTTGRVIARIRIDSDVQDVLSYAGAIWLAAYGTGRVLRVDPKTNKVSRKIRIPGATLSGITRGGGAVWVGQTQGSAVFRIDPKTNRVATVRTGALGPAWLATSGDAVWISNIYDKSVMRLDPVTRKVTARIAVGADPVNLEVIGRTVWVPNDRVNTVTRIDADTAKILEVIPTAANPAVVGVGCGRRVGVDVRRRGRLAHSRYLTPDARASRLRWGARRPGRRFTNEHSGPSGPRRSLAAVNATDDHE